MNELKIFDNEQFGKIRTVEIEGAPWFCLADVCKPLGLQAKHCKERLKEDGVVLTDIIDSIGRPQRAIFINEGNLYRTIFQSKKPEAEAFTAWVTDEVLPTLRKTGHYTTPAALPNISPAGLALLIRVTRRVMLDAGSNAADVIQMARMLYQTWGVPVPPTLAKQANLQLSLFDAKPILKLET